MPPTLTPHSKKTPFRRATLNEQLRLLHVNDRFAQLTGKPASFHRGKPLRALLPFLAPVLEPVLRQLLRTGRRMSNVRISGRRRGRTKLDEWLVSGSVAGASSGGSRKIHITLEIADDRRQAEARKRVKEKLRRNQLSSEERFRRIVEASPNALILADRRGTMRIVNAQTEKIFGYTREELIGQSVEILIPGQLAAIHQTRSRPNLSKLVLRPGRDVFGKSKDGQDIPIEIGFNPIESDSGIQVLASITDISERRRSQLEAQQIREDLAHMGRVSTAGELVASVAHELNQPLTAILSNAQAAMRILQMEAPDLNEVRDILLDIVGDDKRAGEVIRRLRNLLKKKEMEFKPIHLNELIQNVVELMHSDAIMRNAFFQLELAPDLPLICGDDVQLQQALLNLFLNGLDAMRETPRYERCIQVETIRADGDFVQISVRDRGHGIANQDMNRLFSPFFTTKTEGLGMGLAITHTIVESHKGRIWAENNPGGGAIFYFTLPTAQPAAVEHATV